MTVVERLRYSWHWLAERFKLLLVAVLSLGLGICVAQTRQDWQNVGLLASLEAQCQKYHGPKSLLAYKDGRFVCLADPTTRWGTPPILSHPLHPIDTQ